MSIKMQNYKDQNSTQSSSNQTVPKKINNVMELIGQQLKTTQPLEIAKQLIKYLQNYVNKLEFGKDITKSSDKQQKDKIKYSTVQIKKKNYEKQQNAQIVYPSRKTRWVKNITLQQQKQKFQEQKFIAFAFIQYGVNFGYCTRYYPQMPPKNYRCYVQAINNQTVNQIVDFLRYQCNIEVQRMNRDQKRSIRTQLTKIRQWLGHRYPDQLNVFYTFIKRHYDRSIEVSMQQALKLYKTILCIIRSPHVNVLQAEQVVEKQKDQQDQIFTPQQVKAMIIQFNKWKDLHKVSDMMCQKYGYDMKWSFHSVKQKLKHLLNLCIDKLIKNSNHNQQDKFKLFFTESKRKILEESNEIDLKIKMYSFYLEKRVSYVKIKNLFEKLKDFYEIYGKDVSSNISLPKLEDTLSKANVSVKIQEPSKFILDQTIKKEEEQYNVNGQAQEKQECDQFKEKQQ